MSVQMTVRIPDELAQFIDQQVSEGARSRADVIARALKAEQRRLRAQHDAAVYAREGEDPELVELAETQRGRLRELWSELD